MDGPPLDDPRFNEPSTTLPHDLEAEQAILGMISYENEVAHTVADLLTADAFHEPYHQRLFDLMVETVRGGRVPEPIYLTQKLAQDPAFVSFGGTDYFVDLYDKAPPSSQAEHYAKVIADTAMRRRLILAGQAIIAEASNPDQEATVLTADAERMLSDVAATGPVQGVFENIGTIFARQFKRSREADGAAPGVPTGIPDLDKKMGGLRPKNQIILGGRPGMAKSAIAVQWAINVARPTPEHPKGQGVMFYSLEMPEEQLATRFGCALAYDRSIEQKQNPTYEDFEKGALNDIQWQKLEAAGRELATLPIEISFKSNMKVSHMLAAARRQKRKWAEQGIPFVLMIVDHFGKVHPEKRINDKVQESSQIADDLLDAAKDLDVAQVVLAQLGRDVDKREDKRPENSDLKWSGNLEENAGCTVFAYRPEYYNREPEPEDKEAKHAEYQRIKARYTNRLMFIVGKNRNGRGNFSVESFCDIGCNVVQNLADPELVNRTIDFSTSRVPDPEHEFSPHDADCMDIPD